MKSLETIERYGITIEPMLRALLVRFENDPSFAKDLDSALFQPHPSPADEIDCLNPWMFVIAMNGMGSAYGLYVHPHAIKDSVAPWVFWEHEDDTVRFLAENTDAFLWGWLCDVASWREDPDLVTRLKTALSEIGLNTIREEVRLDYRDEGDPGAPWLPPIGKAIEDVSTYLALLSTDPHTAERGLLAHQMGGNCAATEALESFYAERGWKPSRAYDP